jgi:hypothetical protein
MKMTLSRALRHKKRVIETIRKFETDIQTANSIVEGEERDIDVRLSLKQRAGWVKSLVALKLALQEATKPIQRLIFELAEAKSEISFYQKLSTEHGTVKSRYGDAAMKYEAEIRKLERDKLVKELQDRIDQLQTKIDAHNATVELEVPDAELP